LRIKRSVIAAVIAFVVIAIVSRGRSSPYNNYVLLAQAFLAGHTWITYPGSYIDALPFAGQYYVIEAPMPALLLLPFVAVLGGANQTLLAIVLAAIGIGAAYEIGERLGVSPVRNAWICAFLLGGTDLLWAAMLGDVWFIAHVSAVCFTLLALAECLGKKRGWLVALFGACAVLSRFDLVLALPVYAYLLQSRRTLAVFAATLAPFVLFWVWYNFARWGTWYDIGYTAWYHQDQAGSPVGSPFQLRYFPYQLWSFFVQTPVPIPRYPYLEPTYNGVALTWTSPALLLAFFARAPRNWLVAMWAAVILTAAPNFVYYVNGYAQFGMRHALDFEPFLVVLMFMAMRENAARWMNVAAYALIAYSVAVGLWGCWFWNSFIRT